MVKTTSIMLQTLCVPCACRCRYCLLSWDGRTIGADWERSKACAAAFHAWLRENRPELRCHFSFGYSMEHPHLPEALDLLRSLGSVGAEFFQCDGLRIRGEAETVDFVRMLREHGVKHLNFTVYGTEAYHDRFAGRKGDYAWLLRLRAAAQEAGLETSVGVPLTRDNAEQLEALTDTLGMDGTRLFIPHAEGRGALLEDKRLRLADYECLSERGKALMNRRVWRTEAEWIAAPPPEPTQRSLLLSLTPENIGRFEQGDFAAVLAEVEALDEVYYAPIPPLTELLRLYGDADGDAFFGARDLAARYQRRWLQEHGLHPYDVSDERWTGSRRF
ncbi:MAG: radical SAM protein [Clostridia bacterium]